VDEILRYLGSSKTIARKKYQTFVADGVDQGQRTELTGGGIIRSLMGAGQTGMTSGGGDFQLGDGRILGDGDFVAAVLAQGEAQLTTKERHRAG